MSNGFECKAKTEVEMVEEKVPWLDTEEQLLSYIRSLIDRSHDYGTAARAAGMAATAAFYYVSKELGLTAFQASCAALDFIRRVFGFEHGFRILDYGNSLYPQYCNSEEFPSWRELIEQNKSWLAKEAKKMLEESPDAAPEVREHWEWLASLDS